MFRHAVTRRSAYSRRLHSLAERIRGHAPEIRQPKWEPVERHDPREVAAFLAAFCREEKR